VANDRIAERQKSFKQYKKDVKERGKPFYPYAVLHDAIMSLLVVVVIIGLAVIWKWSIPGNHANTESGLLGKLYDTPADPGSFSFIPRPDWYFYFAFYLLRIFKWPESVILGTVGIPTLLLLLLAAMPFIDLRSERHPLRRPVALIASVMVVISMGVLTYKGATAKEGLGSDLLVLVKEWGEEQGFSGNAQAVEGANLFGTSGCTNCHTYLGAGSSNLGAPDLSAEGSLGKGIDFQIKHLKDPGSVTQGSPMNSYAALGEKNLAALAEFLEASKGPK